MDVDENKIHTHRVSGSVTIHRVKVKQNNIKLELYSFTSEYITQIQRDIERVSSELQEQERLSSKKNLLKKLFKAKND